jgi:hypothetical protein
LHWPGRTATLISISVAFALSAATSKMVLVLASLLLIGLVLSADRPDPGPGVEHPAATAVISCAPAVEPDAPSPAVPQLGKHFRLRAHLAEGVDDLPRSLCPMSVGDPASPSLSAHGHSCEPFLPTFRALRC